LHAIKLNPVSVYPSLLFIDNLDME
jgi:hypothetical protein